MNPYPSGRNYSAKPKANSGLKVGKYAQMIAKDRWRERI